MKVKALVSFASPFGRHSEGEVFDLPKGVDWLKAGLVEKIPITKRVRKSRKSDDAGGGES